MEDQERSRRVLYKCSVKAAGLLYFRNTLNKLKALEHQVKLMLFLFAC